MNTAIRILRTAFKVLLLLIILPFILVWLLVRLSLYKNVLITNLVQHGMPKKQAIKLANEIKLNNIFSFQTEESLYLMGDRRFSSRD